MPPPPKPRHTVADFDPQVLRLFDQYVHGDIDRREFLKAATTLAGGFAGATGLLAALAPDFASAQQVAPDDSRLATDWLEFASPDGYGKGRGYLAHPTAEHGPLPVVLVVHENRGLNPHIEDVTRRLALEGFMAFAPDALFPLGGYPGDEDSARAEFAKLDSSKSRADFLTAAAFAEGLPGSNGKLGAVGFCWGGGIVNMLATQCPSLDAAAPFYGAAPPRDDVSKINAQMLIVLAGQDERINAMWPEYRAALDQAHATYELFQPDGTQHGFNNDTTPRYDAAAAAQAWGKMLELFHRTLKT